MQAASEIHQPWWGIMEPDILIWLWQILWIDNLHPLMQSGKKIRSKSSTVKSFSMSLFKKLCNHRMPLDTTKWRFSSLCCRAISCNCTGNKRQHGLFAFHWLPVNFLFSVESLVPGRCYALISIFLGFTVYKSSFECSQVKRQKLFYICIAHFIYVENSITFKLSF